MQTKNSIIQDFTKGPLFKPLLFFSLSFMGSNALQALYSVVDMVVVGHYVGRGGLGAVGLTSQIFHGLTMLCAGLSSGGQILLSQLVGSGNREKLSRAICTMFSVIMGLGVLMTALSLTFARPILRLLNTPDVIFKDAMAYMLVCSIGLVFAYGYNMVSAILRGLGDSRHPFIFIAIASVLNVVLDLLFIVKFHWGVFGAGLATILGQALSFLWGLWFFYRHRQELNLQFQWSSLKIDFSCMKELFRLGLPLAARFCLVNVSMLFVSASVASLGEVPLATFGAGIKLDDLANKVCLGLMTALTSVVAQNYAAGRVDRVRRAVWDIWLLGIVIYLIYGCFLWFRPEQLFSIFSTDDQVLKLSHVFAQGMIWTFPALLLIKGTNGFIFGIGKTTFAFCLSLLDGLLFRILFTYLCAFVLHWGFLGCVLGFSLAPYGSAIPGMLYFFFGKWAQKRPSIVSEGG